MNGTSVWRTSWSSVSFQSEGRDLSCSVRAFYCHFRLFLLCQYVDVFGNGVLLSVCCHVFVSLCWRWWHGLRCVDILPPWCVILLPLYLTWVGGCFCVILLTLSFRAFPGPDWLRQFMIRCSALQECFCCADVYHCRKRLWWRGWVSYRWQKLDIQRLFLLAILIYPLFMGGCGSRDAENVVIMLILRNWRLTDTVWQRIVTPWLF